MLLVDIRSKKIIHGDALWVLEIANTYAFPAERLRVGAALPLAIRRGKALHHVASLKDIRRKDVSLECFMTHALHQETQHPRNMVRSILQIFYSTQPPSPWMLGGRPPDFVESLGVLLFKRNYIAICHCRTERFFKAALELGRLLTSASIAFVMCGGITVNEPISNECRRQKSHH
jgi:hypothetical protein